MQEIILNKGIGILQAILLKRDIKKFLLVCDSAYEYLPIKKELEDITVPYIKFCDFTFNPLYEDVCKGVQKFQSKSCDAIVAIGGGSAMDVAKCIKLFSKMNPNECYLLQEYKDTEIPLIAVPTTAGTGSESTRYAVIYYNGEKQSVTHESIIPDYAILEPKVLRTLPDYQKKCTLLDALCQGIESFWSVNSTKESMEYSKTAIELIMQNKDAYINENLMEAAEKIMLAANYAGRAINITQTTAAHAMSYKLTSLYGIPHGHAVAVCLPKVWEYMQKHIEDCIDVRGKEYLFAVFKEIAKAMGQKDIESAIQYFENILWEFRMPKPLYRKKDLEILTSSVNVVRLKNNPVALTEEVLYELYQSIMKRKE